jgi:hypothetical protein
VVIQATHSGRSLTAEDIWGDDAVPDQGVWGEVTKGRAGDSRYSFSSELHLLRDTSVT